MFEKENKFCVFFVSGMDSKLFFLNLHRGIWIWNACRGKLVVNISKIKIYELFWYAFPLNSK